MRQAGQDLDAEAPESPLADGSILRMERALKKRTASDISLRDLEVFVGVIEHQLQQPVADREGLSQPTISKYLGRLSECVEPNLLFTGGEKYELTIFGEEFLAAARTVIQVLRGALPPLPSSVTPVTRIDPKTIKIR